MEECTRENRTDLHLTHFVYLKVIRFLVSSPRPIARWETVYCIGACATERCAGITERQIETIRERERVAAYVDSTTPVKCVAYTNINALETHKSTELIHQIVKTESFKHCWLLLLYFRNTIGMLILAYFTIFSFCLYLNISLPFQPPTFHAGRWIMTWVSLPREINATNQITEHTTGLFYATFHTQFQNIKYIFFYYTL